MLFWRYRLFSRAGWRSCGRLRHGCSGALGSCQGSNQDELQERGQVVDSGLSGNKEAENRALFKWVAVLTGSKNALKGVGFLLGGVLLGWFGFQWTLWIMAGALCGHPVGGHVDHEAGSGQVEGEGEIHPAVFQEPGGELFVVCPLFPLWIARYLVRGGLPVFLKETLNWSFAAVGSFMAAWVIGYGLIQAGAPASLRQRRSWFCAEMGGNPCGRDRISGSSG